jgi:hypothetical protein
MRETTPQAAMTRRNGRRRRAIAYVGALSALSLMLAGCVSAPALRQSVLAYDQTTEQLSKEIMLVNIARVSERGNPHFTVTGSIAATFDFTTTAAVAGNITQTRGTNTLNLAWGASASENPTFQIIPIVGEEFTKRLANALPENVFATLVFQGEDTEQVARLLASGIEVQKSDGRFERFILNDPSVPGEYEEFRRFARHLAWLQKSRNLFLSELRFNKVVLEGLKAPPSVGDLVNKGLKAQRAADGTYTITQTVRGRVLVSNYDPRALSHDDRHRLNELAEENPGDFVMIDIRPDHPGGDYPLFGAFKLRSLIAVLRFVGEGIELNREFEVAKDPRTRGEVVSPTSVLAIYASERPPTADVPTTFYKGRYYWVGDTKWDRTGFFILNLIFQFTVSKISDVGIPITISK